MPALKSERWIHIAPIDQFLRSNCSAVGGSKTPADLSLMMSNPAGIHLGKSSTLMRVRPPQSFLLAQPIPVTVTLSFFLRIFLLSLSLTVTSVT